MKKIIAVLAVLAGLVLAIPAPAQASYNSVYHSQWSGTWGALKVTCNGGAVHHVPATAYSPCWNTFAVENAIAGGAVRCSFDGWARRFVVYPGAGAYNCRSSQ